MNASGKRLLAIVAPGTFTELRAQIAASDLPPAASQLKIPRKLANPSQRALLESAVIADS